MSAQRYSIHADVKIENKGVVPTGD